MRLLTPAAVLGVLSVLVPARALHADVLVVGPSPAPYTEIQGAVDAAVDGDVVLVRAGTYESFVVRNKELAVVADTGATVNIHGAVRVSGLAATRTVVLVGLRATGTTTTSAASRHGLFARDCAGSVRALDCSFTGVPLNEGISLPPSAGWASPSLACYEGQGAWVETCADVAFVRCGLSGSNAPSTAGWLGYGTRPWAALADGGHGLHATGSSIALYESALGGGRGGWGDAGFTSCQPPPLAIGYLGTAGEGCRTSSTFVFGAASSFVGANGWGSSCIQQCWCEYPTAGGNAFVQDPAAGPAVLLGCAFTPGVGGLPNGSACPCGIGGNFCNPNAPPGANGAVTVGPVQALGGTARRMNATSVVREGQSVTLTFTGLPGDRVELMHSERTGFQYQAGARGVLLVRRTRPMLVQRVGTIGASGTLVLSWTVPELGAGVQARHAHFQAAMIDPTGQTTLAAPAAVLLLDGSF